MKWPTRGNQEHLWGALRIGLGLSWAVVAVWAVNRQGFAAEVLPVVPYPTTDWVRWADTPNGPVAQEILPPVRFNEVLGASYVAPNERLLAVDYRPVFTRDAVLHLTRNAGTGTVFLYRLSAAPPGATARNQYIVSAYRPTGLATGRNSSWVLGGGLYLLLLGLGLFFLALLIPLARTNLQRHRGGVVMQAAVVLLGGIGALRYGALLLDQRLEYLPLERWLGSFHFLTWDLLILLLAGNIGHRNRWPKGLFLGTVSGAVGLLFAAYLWGVTGEQPGLWLPVLWPLNWSLFALVLALFVFSRVPGEAAVRAWPLGALGGLCAVLAMFLPTLTVGKPVGQPMPDGWTLAVLALITLPMGFATGSSLRFGNVNQVAYRIAVVVLVLVLAAALYAGVRFLLGEFARGTAYRLGLELLLVFLLLLFVRALLRRYGGRLGTAFVLPAERRRRRLLAFIARIPRYAHSGELLKDVEAEARAFFGLRHFAYWSFLQTETDAPPFGLTRPEVDQVYNTLTHYHGFWAYVKVLSPIALPRDYEERLSTAGWRLLFPVSFADGERALVGFGERREGVYTVNDVELAQRIVLQLQLTLEILRLLEKEKELAEKTVEANLIALRSQINPHFLFNTLNTISALIHDSPNLAEEAVEKLAYIFRHTLRHSKATFVSIGTEWELVRTYLEIEKIRFGDRLALQLDVPEAVKEIPMPALVLQTLVENCIKHGIAKITEQGRIEISIVKAQPWVEIRVYDNGPGIDTSRIRKGTGVKNVLQRLEDLYRRNDLIHFENTGNGTLVSLRLPLDTAPFTR